MFMTLASFLCQKLAVSREMLKFGEVVTSKTESEKIVAEDRVSSLRL